MFGQRTNYGFAVGIIVLEKTAPLKQFGKNTVLEESSAMTECTECKRRVKMTEKCFCGMTTNSIGQHWGLEECGYFFYFSTERNEEGLHKDFYGPFETLTSDEMEMLAQLPEKLLVKIFRGRV